MINLPMTGPDLTHLDQCFLVIVRPQGFAQVVIFLQKFLLYRWEIIHW